MAKRYTVSDGKLVLTLEEADEGGYVVTSPLDPSLITEAETVREAFTMARDAMKTLRHCRSNFRNPPGVRGFSPHEDCAHTLTCGLKPARRTNAGLF